MKKMNKKAFTLIELIVVIAVVGILVLLGMPRFIGYKDKAELARIQHDVKVMEQEVGTVLINNDDVFDKWEDNSKDFNQLIQEDKLFEKEGPVATGVEPIDGSYKVIPEEYKDKINTKLKGPFYANSGGKVYYEHVKSLSGIPVKHEEKEPGVPVDPEKPAEPGEEKEQGYSDEEIQGLIAEGYIPIATADELNNIRSATSETYGKGTEWEGQYTGGLDKQYVQVLNIDLSGYDSWSPIGAESSIFTGTYDGGSYVITDLEVKGDGSNHQGLFGRIEGATIRNVALEDINVTGSRIVGGLVGQDENSSTIENSYATGSVIGSGERVGGLVGQAWGTTISNSYATGSVDSSGDDAGGLVGLVSGGTIGNSFAIGSVEGKDRVGGLVGYTQSNTKISNSYATGSVKGIGRAGGLVGSALSHTKISNSYATGPVKGTSDGGGLVGQVRLNIEISNSYWNKETTGQSTSASGGTGKTTDEMKKSATYEGWDFDTVWKIDEGNDYPKLR